MIRVFLSCSIFLSFCCLKCFSQNVNIWDYRERIFVEKKQNMYILECFHHKVEMITDTLLLVRGSTYTGKKYTLIDNNGQLYIQSNNSDKKLKLKISTNEALKSRQMRKEYYLQFTNERHN